MNRPTIVVSTGDPAGVGPELSLRVVDHVRDRCVPVLLGDARVLQAVATKLGYDVPKIVSAEQAAATDWQDWVEPVLVDVPTIGCTEFEPGQVNPATGKASYEYVLRGIDACLAKRAGALVTAPIHKDAMNSAGIAYPGHTEILWERTHADRICMMLTSETITCSVVTAHVGLYQVSDLLTEQRVFDAIELSAHAMRKIRGRPARVIVCGLNPHAGEGGLFGRREEQQVIEPAIERARASGIEVRGPLPADTAFIPSLREQTDCYVCMYHDQGLIPLKALAFDTAVNVTLGLPIVRTSVDHGTALDLAWQGTASVSSFVSAMDLAIRLAVTE